MVNFVFKFLYILFITFSLNVCSNEQNEEKIGLPYCGPADYSHYKTKKLVFVSTLDGHISLLNIADGGAKKWSMPTGPGPMLSSNIHKLELTNNGQWVRMIPSLNGGLYKFNGEFIEAIPINAEHLLKSSFRYSDDLVISGGKESRTYGVEVESGRVLYECTMNSCDNITEDEVDNIGDVLLIQRLTQTVRAVEPRTGAERWNFSVGQHDVKFLPDPAADCHVVPDPSSDVILKVIVPEGLICALSRTQPGKLLWTHKFESPVVNAWRLDKGQLELVDLFGGKTPALPHATADSSTETSEGERKTSGEEFEKIVMPDSPALYVGMHKKQLYIQESVTVQSILHKVASQYKQHMIGSSENPFPRMPWQPVSARALVLGSVGKRRNELKKVLQITDESSSSSNNDLITATSVLYGSEYVNGNGYYLYAEETVEKSNRGLCHPSNDSNNTIEGGAEDSQSIFKIDYEGGNESDEDMEEEEEDDTPVQVIIVSLWYWWKEVFVISISTAVVVNILLQRRPIFRAETSKLNSAGNDSGVDVSRNYSVVPYVPNDYISRYLTDFEPVHCLGKGGFGVVFEAKNKIDDCRYAIKRIPLPNRQESRERVMREVKALAKLDHRNIVRYFNAWLECPPPGWQEAQDKYWTDKSTGFDDGTATSLNTTSHLTKEAGTDNHVTDTGTGASTMMFNRNNDSSLAGLPRKSYGSPDDDDSFQIVFDKSGNSGANYEQSVNGCDKRLRSEDNDNCDISDNCDNLSIAVDDGDVVKDSVIVINSSGTSNATTVTTISDNNNDEASLKNRKLRPNYKKHKRPSSLSFRKEDMALLGQKISGRMFLFIQMQLCRKESLREWLEYNAGSITRDRREVLSIFEQIVQAVEYVHLKGLIHRDLKPSNIFFSPDGQIKIGDFGLVTAMVESGEAGWSPTETTPDGNSKGFSSSKNSSEKHTARVGTHLYMSPEQVQGKLYSYKVDIYSLGLILFELLVPFNTTMERLHTLGNLRKSQFPSDFQSNFKNEFELLSVMLSHNPDERPTTIGIRARPPLMKSGESSSAATDDTMWHFELPSRRKTSSHSSSVES